MCAQPIIRIEGLAKSYDNGFQALKGVSLDIAQGEILAMLGPNGAGKTTLISIVCGLVNPTGGTVEVAGNDILRDYRKARDLIGLVPQEIALDIFSTPWKTVSFSRGLFGKPRDDAHIEKVLRDLSLWDKKDSRIQALSGGMKRRVVIAKALAHEPRILFLDEPTAGVDVELRREMWEQVRALREAGVTIILTTHYIEEAEEMADRVAVINHGEIVLVENKNDLMKKMGKKELNIALQERCAEVPPGLGGRGVRLSDDGMSLHYEYDARAESTGITGLLTDLSASGIRFTDIETRQSSLEDIFVHLVEEDR